MKKFLSVLFLFFLSISLFAVSPHPDVVNNYKKNGKLPQLTSKLKSMQEKGIDKADKVFPTTGNNNVLVILVQYSDTSMNTGSTTGFYDTLFTGATTSSLSWRKYYYDMSGGDLDLNFTVVGPYTASNSLFYYGQNDSSGNDMYPGHLVGEAVDAAESDGVDFSPFDNDGDGNVDAVIVIHAGRGEHTGAPASTIWAHRWTLSDSGAGTRTYDGVTINDYTIQPEYDFSAGDSTIGVFCHEFGHILGLPDLYDTSYTTDGVGKWSLMGGGSYNGPGNNGSVPAPLLAWEKQLLGWANVTVADNSSKSEKNNFFVYTDKIINKIKSNKNIIVAANTGIFGFILLISIILNFIFGKNKKISGILLPLFFCFMMPLFFFNFTACPVTETEQDDPQKPITEKSNIRPSSLTVPSSGSAGSDITITMEIENNGKKNAGAFSTEVYISDDNVISTDDTLIKSIDFTGGILKDETLLNSFSYTLPDTGGEFYIGYIIDPDESIDESDEEDNITGETLVSSITITTPEPNLCPDSLDIPSTAAKLTDITIDIVIENTGEQDAAAFSTAVYLSIDNIIDDTDNLIDTISHSGLTSQTTASESITYTLPDTTGTFYIGYIVDSGTEVTESNESDNITVGSLVKQIEITQGPMPNIKPETIDVPSSGIQGTDVAISIQIENDGDDNAGAFTTKVYRSSNNTINDSDVLIDTISHTGLNAGDSASETITYTLPGTTGTYYIGYIVDTEDTVDESNESDNITSGVLVKQIEVLPTPKPNLKPVSVSVPSSGTQGDDVTISVTIRNDDDGDAGSFITRVYRSTNDYISTSDTLIGTINHTGLTAQSEVTESITYTLPSITGTYYIGYIVDALNTVDEDNETDNTTSSTITRTIDISPALTPASLEDVDLNNNVLKISTGYSQSGGEQYYLIENKVKKTGTWSEYLPGSGLLIVLIDDYIIYNINLGSVTGTLGINYINSLTATGTGWMHGVTIIESDNNKALWSSGGDTGSSTDTFYSGNAYSNNLVRNHYTSSTSGIVLGTNSGVMIYNISVAGSTMTFDYLKP